MNQTYAEYYETESQRVAVEYGIAVKEVKRQYPDRFDDYWRSVRNMAENCELIPERVLDCIAKMERRDHPTSLYGDGICLIRYLRHDHERSLPEGYFTPSEKTMMKW